MVLKVSFSHDLEKKEKSLQGLENAFDESKKAALSSSANFLREKARDYIESEGEGNWPKLSPITKDFDKKFLSGSDFNQVGFLGELLDRGAFHFLGKFVRYRVDKDRARIRYGKTARGDKGQFDRNLNRIGNRVERGQRIVVTPRMRRFFAAATLDKRTRRPIYPIKKSTTVLVVPPRPIGDPVFNQNANAACEVFEKKFCKSLEGKFSRL